LVKRFVVVSSCVGFLVPIFWGVVGFLTFSAPENVHAEMFWDTVHRTCPPWLITGPSIFAESWATPVLNAALYGAVALVVALPFKGISSLIHLRLRLGPRALYGALAVAGLCAVVVATLVTEGEWTLVVLHDGSWITIVAVITYFTMGGRKQNVNEGTGVLATSKQNDDSHSSSTPRAS
jgi:hypothetical protein